jgi:hypothetical protein
LQSGTKLFVPSLEHKFIEGSTILILIVLLLKFSAGIGVLNMAKQAVARMLGTDPATEPNCQFWLIDKDVSVFFLLEWYWNIIS